MNAGIRQSLADRAANPDLYRCLHAVLPGETCGACAVLAEPWRSEAGEPELDADGWHAGRVLDEVPA